MSYSFFQQVVPPTGVELCVAARFTGEEDNNLLVAKANVLDVYALHRHATTAATTALPPRKAPSFPSTFIVFFLILFRNLFILHFMIPFYCVIKRSLLFFIFYIYNIYIDTVHTGTGSSGQGTLPGDAALVAAGDELHSLRQHRLHGCRALSGQQQRRSLAQLPGCQGTFGLHSPLRDDASTQKHG